MTLTRQRRIRRAGLVAASSGAVALLTAASASAGSAYYDLKDGPPPGLVIVGSAEWVPEGGNDGKGHIKLTDNTGQSCAVLFPDFDNKLVVKAFEFECLIKLGDWYNNPPADGFSVNYVNANDPIVALIEGGTNPGRGGRTDGWAGSWQNNGNEDNLPEEGTQTGIAVGFDTWGTGNPPVGGSNGPLDVRGISVRVDGNQIAQIAMPNVLFPDNYDFLGDPTTLITGPFTYPPQPDQNPNYGDPTQGAPPAPGTRLGWAPLKVVLDENGVLNVFWKGANIVKDFQTQFAPRPGRILFGASTGGAMEYAGIDEIRITTIPADKLIVGPATGNPVGFSIQVINSGPAVADLNTARLELDGAPVTPTRTSFSDPYNYIDWWDLARPLAPGSTHTVKITIKDTRGIEVSGEKSFTVPNYVTVPAELAVSDVNTAQRGFNVRVHQTALRGQPNTIARAEQQLQGLRGANVADLSGFVGGVYAETDVINYNQDAPGGVGVFQAPDWEDKPIPGIPSATETNPDGSPYTDNIAAEITTYIHFAQAGVYELFFNSDDGFRTTVFNGVNEVLVAPIVGQFDGGRGAADTASLLYVPQAGYYGLRTVWFEGEGGANLEWSGRQTLPTATTRQLLNSSAPDSLKTYRSRASAGPAVVSFTHPFRTSGNPYLPTTALVAKIQDGDTAVNQDSIKMFLDGTEVAVTKSKTGNTTTVTHDPAGLLPAGTHNLKVTFSAGAQNYEGATDFTIANLPVVPPSLALPASAVDRSKRGFLVKTVQNASYTSLGTRGNDTYAGESQINSLLGLPNTADLSSFTGPQGRYVETDVINYLSTGDDGWFDSALGYPDYPVPGIPGIDPRGSGAFPPATDFPDGGQDNYSQEILTVLDLPAGLVAMNVNSDDGFRLTIGNPNEWWTLPVVVGEFSGGRGAGGGLTSGTTFTFYVQQAGLYPARLIWYEGGGGSSIEWSSRLPVDENTGYPNHGNATLINDSMVATSIKAYQYPFPNPNVPWVKSFAPGRDRTSAGSQARAGSDAPVSAVIVEGTANIDPASVQLTVDGTAVTPTVIKAGGELKVSYTPTTPWADGLHPVVLTFGDRTVSWSFRTTSALKTPVFFIEAEDFDNNGAGLAEASQMPYAGGAYAGLKAIVGTDYQRGDGPDSPLYRHGVNPRVSMDRTGDRTRGVGDIKVNYKLGWIGSGQWYNYTRDLPAGKYNLYGGFSHGDTGAIVGGALSKVSGGTETPLGVFEGPAPGGWGNNALVPLKTAPGGDPAVLDLGGPTTLRVAPNNGDWDFMLLVPAVTEAPPPQFTGIRLNPDRTITIEWTGGGTLQAAPSVTGPWVDVTGATSPFTFTPTQQMQFGRIRR